jgi:pilus assembly protein FimV
MVNPQFGSDADLAPEFEISPNEEVATKLDLAKAYEEMGDLEGARELLQEVVKEGDAGQQEKAQALLARIAG